MIRSLQPEINVSIQQSVNMAAIIQSQIEAPAHRVPGLLFKEG
jgi:hypothetical protein